MEATMKAEMKAKTELRITEFDDKGYRSLPIFERRLKFLIEDTPHEYKMPYWLESSSGLGKTTRVREFVEKGLKRKCHMLYLATQDVGDLIGLMKAEDGVTKWLKPQWLNDIQEGDVLVLDEFNRAPVYILNAVMSMLLENKLHTHDIPKNVQKIALCNVDDGDYQVTTITDPAILSRFVRLKYELGVTDWVGYANGNGVDPAMIETVTKEPMLLGNKHKNYEMKYYPNSRSATLIGRLLNIPSELYELIGGHEIVTGALGPAYSIIYDKAKRQALHSIDPEALCKSYKAVKSDVKKALKQKDIAIIDHLNRKLVYKFKELFKNIKGIITEDKKYMAVIGNVQDYLLDLPDASSVAFLKLVAQDIDAQIYNQILSAMSSGAKGHELFLKVKTDMP